MHTVLYPVNELKIGGAEQQLLELVRGIDKSRFQPIVAPLYPGGALDAEFRSIPGVEVIDLHRRSKYDPLPIAKVARLIWSRRVDVVQPFLTPATFFGLLPGLMVRARVTIVTERCGVRQSRGAGYTLYRVVEDRLSRFADAIVPNSQAGQEMLLHRGLPSGRVHVIYNGINEDRLRTDPDDIARQRSRLNATRDDIVVGILASLTPAKGHDTLMRAIARVRERDARVRLAIVGDGPRRATLEALAGELGIASSTVFFGYQRRVADLLGAFDLLVSASRDNEGCSNSILEAMALGVPVIATDVGGNQELVRHRETGFLVPAEDDVKLARAIIRAINAPLETRLIALRAREMITQRFSLTRMVHDYEDLYLRLLGAEPTIRLGTAPQSALLLSGQASIEHGGG